MKREPWLDGLTPERRKASGGAPFGRLPDDLPATAEERPPSARTAPHREMVDGEEVLTVYWLPIVCPGPGARGCGAKGSKEVVCYKTHGRVRYHRCRRCKIKFRSVEGLPRDYDRG